MDLLEGYGSSDEESAAEVEVHSKRGKKILSLTAVLPQAILDELTKSQIQGSDSDDEDDVPKQKSVSRQENSLVGSRDEGLSSLLSDLRRAPAARDKNSIGAESAFNKPSVEKMGDAFLTSVSVVVEQSKTDGTVREIHKATSEPTTRESLAPVSKRVPPSNTLRKSFVVSLAPKLPQTEKSPAIENDASENDASENDASDRSTTKETLEYEQSSNKRRTLSRRELEKALRQGTLPEELDNVATNMQQPEQFTPQPETYAVPRHGIKVSAAAAIYDPSKGHAVGGGAGRGKGKNQIHHLMATAANLELQRARGLASDPKAGKVHRVNAKRKYGW